jgi:dUTP pyrophosphatase
MENNCQVKLFIKKVKEDAIVPKRGSLYAAGYDLYAAEEKIVPSKGKALIRTGLIMAIPHGNYGRVAPRSGLALKNFIDVGAGVVDSDYRGEGKP